jgi:hypothetical protein
MKNPVKAQDLPGELLRTTEMHSLHALTGTGNTHASTFIV